MRRVPAIAVKAGVTLGCIMLYRILVLLAFLVSLNGVSGCGGGGSSSGSANSSQAEAAAGFAPKIFNGVPLDPASVPQVVRLQLISASGSVGLCTGTVVSDNKILTAAHCFNTPPTAVTIDTAFGSVSASSYFVHPGFVTFESGLM